MILSTERLNITAIDNKDAAFYLELLNTPNWLQHIGDRQVYSMKDAEAYIQKHVLNSYKTNGFGFYKLQLKETKEKIGVCGFAKRDYLPHPDIGYAILPKFEGRGYTYEAAAAMMQFGIEVLNMDTILGITSNTNFASQHLLTKIGLHKNGTLKEPESGEAILLYSNKK